MMTRKAALLLGLVFLVPACGGGQGGTPPPGAGVPVLTLVNPSWACVGDSIQVSGSGFGAVQGTSTLTISGATAGIVSWSDTSINATIPIGATSGVVRVTKDGIESNSGYLVVLWTPSDQDLPLCGATGEQMNGRVAPDGSGGAILVWSDSRNDSGDIYAQRVDGAGVVQWGPDGVAICATSGAQWSPEVIPDGSGGAIILWSDDRNSEEDLYIQRVNGSGTVQWAADGVPLNTAPDWASGYQIIPDGSGGAFIAWHDYRSGTKNDIYAQRIDSAGTALWTADGVAVCTTAANHQNPQMAPDGAGGIYLVWEDGPDLYCQRLDSAGNLYWATDGVALCTAAGVQGAPKMTTDGTGGAIIVWSDFRNGLGYRTFGQRIDGAGSAYWTPNGKDLFTTFGNQGGIRMVSDGSGGAIIVMEAPDASMVNDIYAQRIDGAGNPQWGPNGIVVCQASGDQLNPQIVSAPAGGAIIVWVDQRLGGIQDDLYGQRVSGSGVLQWASDGVPVRIAPQGMFERAMIDDGAGGAVVVWDDNRNGTVWKVYAQGITPGTLP